MIAGVPCPARDRLGEKMKISIIIPVYNEKETILRVLQRVQAVPLEKEIIVIDDGSTDGTGEVLRRLHGQGNIRVIFQEKNRGKGAAVRRGLKEVSGEIVAIQDADLEYNPEDYLHLVEPILKGQSRVVYGSRFLGRNAFPPVSFLANKFLTFLVNIFYGGKLTDMETCYKVFRREAIVPLSLRSERFEIEVEVTCKLLLKKEFIYELPIHYQCRSFFHGKKIGWIDGLKALWAILKYRF